MRDNKIKSTHHLHIGGKKRGNHLCIMATLSILEIGPVIFGTTENLVSYLQQRQLLPDSQTCVNCTMPMNLGKKADVSDGCIFRCSICKTTKSLRVGSFFSKNKLTLQKWLVLIYWWVRDYPVSDAAEKAQVVINTAINVYQWLREVCSAKLLGMSIQLGGPGKVVQIDESLFRHKPKVYCTT